MIHIKSVNTNDIEYRYIISGISKSKAVNSLQSFELSEKSGTL